MAYISGFVIPVATANKAAYLACAEKSSVLFRDYGALSVVEGWGDNVPEGKVTDFRRAVAATEEETVVFSWIVWPDRETCDASEAKMMADPRMKAMGEMPFDTGRMIFGGFTSILEA